MKTILIGSLLVVLGLLSVVSGAPAFGTYNCATSTWNIVNNGLLVGAGSYAIAASTNASARYEYKLNFNASAALLGAGYNPYFTAYVGQNYAIFDLSSNSTTPVSTATVQDTCSQTLANFGDEATRVYDLSRAPGTPAYRNDLLDRAATDLINSNGTLSVSPNYNTAPGTTTVSYIAGTLSLVNPGAIIQTFLNSNSANLSRAARELGVYYSPARQQMGFVFASRVIACGNGVLDSANETCDDNNTVSGDGCSANCQIESGYNCTQTIFNETSVCVRASNSTSNSTTTSNSTVSTPSASLRAGNSSVVNNSTSSNSSATTPSASLRAGNTSVNTNSTGSNSTGISPSGNPSVSPSTSSALNATRSTTSTVSVSTVASVSPSTTVSISQRSQNSPSSTNTASATISVTSNPSFTTNPSVTSSTGTNNTVVLPSDSPSPNGGSVGSNGGSASSLKTWLKFMF